MPRINIAKKRVANTEKIPKEMDEKKISNSSLKNMNYFNKRSLKIIFWPAIRKSKRSDMHDCFPTHSIRAHFVHMYSRIG